MMFRISLFDWRGKETEVEFSFSGVSKIIKYEVTGDEVLKVIYDDYYTIYDSSSTRRNDYIDSKICLFDRENPENGYYTMEELINMGYLVEEE